VTLWTGRAEIEGQDEPIDRRKNPLEYWALILVVIILSAAISQTVGPP
jgi:hypothetical protein